MADYSFLSYKKGSSFLHKCPAWCKILFIPLINILFLILPVHFSFGLIFFQFILAVCLKFTFKEIISDLKPVFFYAVLLIFFELLTWLGSGAEDFLNFFSWENEKDVVYLLVKIFAVMQTASIVFKTSTTLEMRDGIAVIFGRKSAITTSLFLFLNFLPLVGKIWEQSKKAWIARGGKVNIRMYIVLMPVLFSVGMKKAYNQARALVIRK